MVLLLDHRKVLPVGIHDATLDELEELFGSYQGSMQRPNLFGKLREYVAKLRSAGIGGYLVVDGSFVMGCIDIPGDIDVVLGLPADWDFGEDLKPFQYNLISKRDLKREFPFDLFAVRQGSAEEIRILDYFAKVNTKWYEPYNFPTDSQKGLVRIAL